MLLLDLGWLSLVSVRVSCVVSGVAGVMSSNSLPPNGKFLNSSHSDKPSVLLFPLGAPERRVE
jgi:hypothetical protein